MRIRCCRPDDLHPLEWGGEYTHDRAIIARTFARTHDESSLMLVAEVDAELVGQVWLDLARSVDVAYLWALRVKSTWRGGGIGSRLLAAAEQLAIARGFAAIDLEVEATNQHARGLYHRRGYATIGTDHGGTRIHMRKRLYADLSDD